MRALTKRRNRFNVNAQQRPSRRKHNMEGNETPKERLKGQPVWVKLEQYARLRALAERDGKPLAAHARRAIELYLRREERKGQTIEVRA
jgi:hypothetical protein